MVCRSKRFTLRSLGVQNLSRVQLAPRGSLSCQFVEMPVDDVYVERARVIRRHVCNVETVLKNQTR